MTGFLLDTNGLSEFNRRGQPDPRVRQWVAAADPNSLHVSIITFGEIFSRANGEASSGDGPAVAGKTA